MIEHRIRHMLEADVKTVLEWRNHLRIRTYMHTNHEISSEEHESWYARSLKDAKTTLLIYERCAQAQGFVKIVIKSGTKIADWGFYTSPTAPKGSGQKMGKLALQYAFTTLGLDKVCGQVLSFNNASIALHKKLGFIEECCLSEEHFYASKPYDAVCFGLLKTNGHMKKKTFK